MIKDKVNFAIVGQGHIGKRHAQMITNNPEGNLVAICDIKDPSELSLPQYHAPIFSSLEEMLEKNPEIDVVVIATPNGTHAELAIQALLANKHIVIEKPMALSKTEGEKVISTALQVHRQVFIVMQNRYSPPSAWLKEIIKENRLGKIFMVQINCYWNRDDRYYKKNGWKGTKDMDGGTLFTQFSHFIDIMFWLFGDIKNISTSLFDFNHQDTTEFEDSGMVQFEFENGGSGSLNFSTAVWDTNFESSMTIIGEKGTVKVGGQYMDKVEYCHVENYKMPKLKPVNAPNDYGHYKGSAANHHFIVSNVIDTLKGRETMTTNMMEGLKVVEIIENIYKSAKR